MSLTDAYNYSKRKVAITSTETHKVQLYIGYGNKSVVSEEHEVKVQESAGCC